MKLVYFSDSRTGVHDLELLNRSHALVVCPGYGASAKCCDEVAVAKQRGIPIFEDMAELSYWLRFNALPSVDKVA